MGFTNHVHTSLFVVITEGTGNSNILKNKGGISCKSISHSCLVGRAQPQAAVRRAFSLRAKLVWLRLRSSCPQTVISVHVLYFSIFLLTPVQLFVKPWHNASLTNLSRKVVGLWSGFLPLMHGFHVWLKWKSPTSKVMALWTKQCRKKGKQLRAVIFKQLWPQRNHVCNCSVRFPRHPSLCPILIQPFCSYILLSCHFPLCGLGRPCSNAMSYLLSTCYFRRFYDTGGLWFIIHHSRCSCKREMELMLWLLWFFFFFKFEFPRRTLALPGPQALNPTVDDIYLMAWKGTSEGCQ